MQETENKRQNADSSGNLAARKTVARDIGDMMISHAATFLP
jgi:hypothetical protein